MIGWLLDTLLYTGALIALVLLARRAVARLFGAQTAYALWALPFLRLLLPPIELPASFAPKAAAVATNYAPAVPPAPGAAMLALARHAPGAGALVSWPGVAVAVWLGGALAFLAWRIASYRAMRRELLARVRTVGEVGRIRLVESPAVHSPVAFGVRDKVVALPLLFMAQPDICARDLAIAHELEHHRGRDLAANFAAQALLALHWFDPVAWLGWQAMRRDQEAACDARVVAGRARGERVRYAELIAGTVAGPRLALVAPMACPVLGDASIVHRLRSLTMAELSPRRRRAGRLVVAGAALALPLTASFSYAAAQDRAAPLVPPVSAAPPAPPMPPDRRAGARHVERMVVRDDDAAAPGEHRVVRRYIKSDAGTAGEPQGQRQRWSVSDELDYASQMDAWSNEMAKWGQRYGKQMAEWGERQGEQARRFALARRPVMPFAAPQPPQPPQPLQPPRPPAGPHAFAAPAAPAAAAPPLAPLLSENCGGKSMVSSSPLAGARREAITCAQAVRGKALESLRAARERIALAGGLTEGLRSQIVQELDEEIEAQGP